MAELRWREKWLEKKALKITVERDSRVFVTILQRDFRKVMERFVKNRGFTQLATITAITIDGEIEVIYHLKHHGLVLSLKTRIPVNKAKIPTIVDLIPGAALYEREIHDLFSVIFIGNSDLSPLILPDREDDEDYLSREKRQVVTPNRSGLEAD